MKKNKPLCVIGAHSGHRYCDNAKYLHQYLERRGGPFEVIWLTRSKEVLRQLQRNGADVAMTYSLRGVLAALRSRIVVRSYSFDDVGYFPYLFSSRKILVNLSHGIPFKHMESYKRNWWNRIFHKIFIFLLCREADVIISESEKSNKDLELLYPKEAIYLTGAPRTDVFFQTKSTATDLKKNIFYAPTWRDYPMELISRKSLCELDSFLGEHTMKMRIKWHGSDSFNHKGLLDGLTNITLADDDVTQELIDAGILITDYSSIFLDFLLLNRPIIFTPHDLDRYEKERGFHYPYERITPGPKTRNWSEVILCLEELLKGDTLSEERIRIRKYFHEFTDGRNSERVIEVIQKKYDEKY